MSPILRMCLAELIGTFALVLAGTALATFHAFLDYGDAGWPAIAAAFGVTLAVLTLVLGPVSGAHLNPAVSIPMGLDGRMPPTQVALYVVAQLIGAVLGSIALWSLCTSIPGFELGMYGLGANSNAQNLPPVAVLAFEAVATAIFVVVILATTREPGAWLAPAAGAGASYFVAVLIGSPLGAGSLNPARSIGPALFEGGDALSVLWMFTTGPVLGGLLGWAVYKFVFPAKIS